MEKKNAQTFSDFKFEKVGREIPEILKEAFRVRDHHTQNENDPSYSCHTKSPYSDGYSDAHYGDYMDAGGIS